MEKAKRNDTEMPGDGLKTSVRNTKPEIVQVLRQLLCRRMRAWGSASSESESEQQEEVDDGWAIGRGFF